MSSINNKKAYRIYIILNKAMPIWFVFLLFLLSKGLSYTEAIFLDSVSAAAALLMEVPSGIFADRTSRKKLILIAQFTNIVNFVTLLFFSNYKLFILSALLSGVGQALISGTAEAMIYDWFEAENKVEEYKDYMGDVNKQAFIVTAAMTLFSSILFEFNRDLPMIISIVFQVMGVCCIIVFSETKKEYAKKKRKMIWKYELREQIGVAHRFICNKKLLKLTVLAIVLLEVISNINYTTQAYLPSLGMNVKYLGATLAVFNFFSAFGAKISDRVKVNGILWITIYVVILVLLAFGNLFITIAVLCCSRFVNGFIWTILSYETNREIESFERATVLSFQNLVTDIFPLFIDPLLGIVYDRKGFSFAYFLMAAVLGMSLVIIILKKKKYFRLR